MLKKLLLSLCFFIITSHAIAAENIHVRITTNMGNIDLLLNKAKAPKTVDNFINYINEGYYSGTVFHRVINNFMIQGGGFTTSLSKKSTHSAIVNEAFNGLKNDKGSIAMARTNAPHSATAQFFINTKDNDFLNHTGKSALGWGYTVFGKVTKGMNIVKKIETTKTGPGGVFPQDVPVDMVIIQKIEVLQ